MNIFVLDSDPIKAARMMCDKHIQSKMIVESGQMLAYCFTPEQLERPDCPKAATGLPRKQAKRHRNHPCSKWVIESKANMEWLIEHALEMCNERMWRWSDSKEHFTRQFIEWCKENKKDSWVPAGNLTPFAVAISESMNCRKIAGFDNLSTVEKYKLYYKHDKPFAKWTKRIVHL
jgi:hypothetical protein